MKNMQMVESMRVNAPSSYFMKVRTPVPDHSYFIKRPSPKKSAKCGHGDMAPRLVVPTSAGTSPTIWTCGLATLGVLGLASPN